MKKLIADVKVTQRTAIGQSGCTQMYVLSNVESNNSDVVVMPKDKAVEMMRYNNSNILGYVNIIHPAILWGTKDEIYIDFAQIVARELINNGIVTTNDYGTMFLK